jgi:hypothetical protein
VTGVRIRELHSTNCLHLTCFPNRIVTFDDTNDQREKGELTAAAS